MLTEAVRRLERDGLVRRVDGRYTLTALGESFLGPIEAFGRWADNHGDEVVKAQNA